MSLANPGFLLLIPVAMFVAAWIYWQRYSPRRKPEFVPSLIHPMAKTFKKLDKSFRTRTLWLPILLVGLSLPLLIFSLARPQTSDQKVKKSIEGIDIMLVLDISDSMLIEDMQPNRLEACKAIMKKFIEARTTDRLGLIVFSGESYTRVPLTLDYAVLTQNLAQVQISRNIKMGTAIGVALADGASRLKDSTARSKVMVFLTDGENNSGTIDPDTALEIAKGFGIRIYSIGAGVDGDAQLPIETTDAFGRKVKRYQPIHSTVNDELLGKIAAETGGKYYRATDNKSLAKVFDEINRLEKTKIDTQQFTRYYEAFQNFLIIAVLVLLAAWILESTYYRRNP